MRGGGKRGTEGGAEDEQGLDLHIHCQATGDGRTAKADQRGLRHPIGPCAPLLPIAPPAFHPPACRRARARARTSSPSASSLSPWRNISSVAITPHSAATPKRLVTLDTSAHLTSSRRQASSSAGLSCPGAGRGAAPASPARAASISAR